MIGNGSGHMHQVIVLAPLAVTFQAMGTLLLSLMLAQLARTFAWKYVRLWAWAWGAMSLSLVALGFDVHAPRAVVVVLFLAGQWLFLLLLWTGCRELTTGKRIEIRYAAYAIPMALAIAVLAARFTALFDDALSAEAAVMSFGGMITFAALGRGPVRTRTTGWETLRISLALLAAVYAVGSLGYFVNAHLATLDWAPYVLFVELLACVCLGFSMIVVTAEHANRGLQEAMGRLESVRSSLEREIQIDPLTEALNRHAYHWMRRGDEITTDGVLSGVLLMIDLDNLKKINDERGHAAGDDAIRAAANAMRAIMRADDLLFRWGGDEFLAVIPNLSLSDVEERILPLEAGISARPEAGGEDFLFHISWGGAEFGAQCSFDTAIALADADMYERRDAARAVHAGLT